MKLNGIRPLRRLICVAAAALACSVAACAAPGGSKASGASEPVTLRIATVNSDLGYTPQIGYLADRVSQLSGGNVRIDHVSRVGNFAPDAEQQVVHGVAAGSFDLGFVGTRIFDTLGVRSFQALTAPMLIDSYPLERAVVGSGIARQMMTGLGRLRVTGLVVLADGLRKPIAVAHPLLGPRDWSGITFATFKSDGEQEAVRALGARVSNLFGNPLTAALRSGKVGAFEKNLLTYQINQQINQQTIAPYVTANLNLWPQTLAVIANPARLAALTAQQRGWLQQAAGDAAARSTGMAATDQRLMESLCKSGTRFADASAADIAGLRAAFAPVYASLEQDPQTKEFIGQIQQLKQQTPPGPALAIPPGCTGPAPASTPAPSPVSTSTAHAGGAAALAGTWAAASYTRAEYFAAGAGPGEDNPDNWGHPSTLKLGQGRFWLSGKPRTSGTYAVRGDKITFYSHDLTSPGSAAEIWGPYTWSVYRDTLTFKKAWSAGDPGGPTGLVVKPWHKVAA